MRVRDTRVESHARLSVSALPVRAGVGADRINPALTVRGGGGRLAGTRLMLVLLVSLLGAQDVRITKGVTDYQVFQRDADGRASIALTGTADKKTNGKYMDARITREGSPVPDFDWMPMSRVQDGEWHGELKGVPAGGPYRIEARISGSVDVTAVENVLVGDLWILAGQSNMEGYGDLRDVLQPQPLVHSFDMTDQWRIAEEPLHTLRNAADRVHWRKNAQGEPERLAGDALNDYVMKRTKGAGLGLPFAVEMLRRTGVPIGLLPCAHGGTSMDQWNPDLKERGSDSLYGAMVRRLRETGGRVKGVLWYQGESDANPKAVSAFPRKFEELVSAIRQDAGDSSLPFYYVQIGRHVSSTDVHEWNEVQEAQRQAESRIEHTGMVASVDCALDDGIHVSTQDHKRLGRRLANLATHDLFPSVKEFSEMQRGPRPVSAKIEGSVVRVTFSQVNGALRSDGRLSGFTIHSGGGPPLPMIFKAQIDDADTNSVMLHIGGKLPENAVLWYGYGKDPYCNLNDTADMAAPVFGPMEIQLR